VSAATLAHVAIRDTPASDPGEAPAAWLTFGHLALASFADRERRRGRLQEVQRDTGFATPGHDLPAARAAFRASSTGDGPFASIAASAGLTTAEAEALAIAAAAELDADLQLLVAAVQRDPAPSRVSLGTLGRVLAAVEPGHVGANAFMPASTLRYAALVDLDGAERPWSDQRVIVQPAVMWALVGADVLDPDLPDRTVSVEVDDPTGASMTLVTGADRLRRREAAAEATGGRRFLACPTPATEAAWAAVVRTATISGQSVIVELDTSLPSAGRRCIERSPHLCWALTSATDLALDELPDRLWAAVQASDADPTDEEWATHLGDAARTHPLSLTQLELAGRAFRAHGGDLDAAVRRLVSGRLEQLAMRIRPTRSWDDVVLSPDRLAQLRSVVDRYRHADTVYGRWGFRPNPTRGIVALFSGVSGTGKTLAAEVLAGELGLDVFKLDLSAIVSKFIGETEKNLEEVFGAASGGNLLLFFDEADALFGKRSEVHDARDRYANIEVSYLLQRLEAYDGLVVMATNFERNVDEAFLRRIHTRIEFVIPEAAEREQIWRRNLPSTAPTDVLDLPWLARGFELSGGSIRNAAVHAAFRAASEGTAIDMGCLVLGVATELRKMGRLVKPDDFGPYSAAVAAEASRVGR
jgi:hypothetical protein